MSESTDARILIIGAGISGSLLARALAQRGKRVLLVDSPEQRGSSPIAAWMINPMTGLRFTASWRISTLLPYARNFYQTLEKESGLHLLHEKRILRFLKSDSERELWEKKASDPVLISYARNLTFKNPDMLGDINTHGCVEIRGGGWVDLGAWLAYHRKCPGPGIEFLSEHFHAEELSVEKNVVGWKGQTFRKALFCSGYSHWPWFDWLPWKASKGEILTLRIPGLALPDIIKKGVFLIPLGADLYRLGATYSWDQLDHQPTERGRRQLLDALQTIIPHPVEVIAHQAGVRPSFQGTIPALGLHPRYPALGIMNGLGSKGGLSAPWLADHLATHLVEGTPLDPEIDVARNF
jgi:glycine oxidase